MTTPKKPDTVERLRLACEVLKGKGEEGIARYCAEGLPQPKAPKLTPGRTRALTRGLTPAALLKEYEEARALIPREAGPSPRWREYSKNMNWWRLRVVNFLQREVARKKR